MRLDTPKGKMIIRESELHQLLNNPEHIISKYNLIYTYEEDFPISRKKHGKGFIYLNNGKRIQKKEELTRIKKLVIPPIWKDVKISDLEHSHLQAVGIDAKNRKQYLYHSKWKIIRNSTKFYKMYAFGNMLPLIRKQLEVDLEKKAGQKIK